MNSNDPIDDPTRIERDIAHTRASLHRKIDELQHRLNPRERVRAETERVKSAVRVETERVKSAVRNVDPGPYAGAAALAAIGVGTAMAVRGLRRRTSHEDVITPDGADFTGE